MLWACIIIISILTSYNTCLADRRYSEDLDDFGIQDIPYKDSRHGNVKMGEINSECDDGVKGIEVDLSQMDEVIVCTWRQRLPVCHDRRPMDLALPSGCKVPEEICTRTEYQPIHKCLDVKISYDEEIPTSGAHRPLWPVYGEYFYLPPQRWIHSLEHDAVVFLYHPCADQNQVEKLKLLARSCLRRHIITPYNLTQEWPFAILKWTCRLMLDRIDSNVARVVEFIKEREKTAPENDVYRDGQYSFMLKQKANIVTDLNDIILCPNMQ